MKWDYLSSPPQTAMQLHRGGLEKTDNLPKKNPRGGSMYSTLGPGYFKESQSLISQAEMAKISGSYISRQDRAPVWYCYFLPGFSRAVNSSCPRQSTPHPHHHPHSLPASPPLPLICSPLSSGDLCHFNPQSLPLVNKEILCQLSPTTSCWESSRESKGPESLSHQRGAVGLIKWPLCPAGCWWPGDR